MTTAAPWELAAQLDEVEAAAVWQAHDLLGPLGDPCCPSATIWRAWDAAWSICAEEVGRLLMRAIATHPNAPPALLLKMASCHVVVEPDCIALVAASPALALAAQWEPAPFLERGDAERAMMQLAPHPATSREVLALCRVHPHYAVRKGLAQRDPPYRVPPSWLEDLADNDPLEDVRDAARRALGLPPWVRERMR